MAQKNFMRVKGRAKGNPNAILDIELADDQKDVRGYGQPITPASAAEMAEEYFQQCRAAWKIVREIRQNPAYVNLRSLPEFAQLESLIDPANQTVSGVFGKEIILQIIAQKGCEGIRYIQGKDNNKNTIVLVGVKETGQLITLPNGQTRATSEPVDFNREKNEADNVIGEVHEEALTIEGVEAILNGSGGQFTKSIDVTFGIF